MTDNEQDELEKIMSEIESLQKDMEPAAASAPTASIASTEEDILREIQAAAQPETDSGLEDTLADIKSEDSNQGVLAETTHETEEEPMEEVMPPKYDSPSGSDGTLSLTLTGNMTLNLKYDYEGQEVMISFTDQSLRVQMSDGTEFKIPVVKSAGAKSGSNVKPFKKAV